MIGVNHAGFPSHTNQFTSTSLNLVSWKYDFQDHDPAQTLVIVACMQKAHEYDKNMYMVKPTVWVLLTKPRFMGSMQNCRRDKRLELDKYIDTGQLHETKQYN